MHALVRAREKYDDATVVARKLDNDIAKIRDLEPPIDYACSRCIEAWHDLGTCRAVGMAIGSIPWTAIVAWADFHELDREATMLLIRVIRHLDCERSEREAAKRRLAGMGAK